MAKLWLFKRDDANLNLKNKKVKGNNLTQRRPCEDGNVHDADVLSTLGLTRLMPWQLLVFLLQGGAGSGTERKTVTEKDDKPNSKPQLNFNS